jgi:hypothetical protein
VIDSKLAKEIMRLSELVKANGLHKVEKFDFQPRFLWIDPDDDPEEAQKMKGDNRANTESNSLVVSDDCFWYAACLKHTSVRIFSALIPLTELADLCEPSPVEPQETIVTNEHLATIVGHLLTNPRSGEVEGQPEFQRFVTAIAQVVCDFCGGEITSPAEYFRETGDMSGGLNYRLRVAANESSPETGGIWQKAIRPFAPAGNTSEMVKHWDCYDLADTKMTHQFDIDDQRQTNGQVCLTLGATEGHIDDMMQVIMEVNTIPMNGVGHVPCAHVHFDSDNLAASLFKIGDNILIRCEGGVTLQPLPGKPGSYWVM